MSERNLETITNRYGETDRMYSYLHVHSSTQYFSYHFLGCRKKSRTFRTVTGRAKEKDSIKVTSCPELYLIDDE